MIPKDFPKIIRKTLYSDHRIKKKERRITDLREWKRFNNISRSTKVFIISNGYGDLLRDLENRGWVRNEDKKSLCFNMK